MGPTLMRWESGDEGGHRLQDTRGSGMRHEQNNALVGALGTKFVEVRGPGCSGLAGRHLGSPKGG